MSKRSTLTPHRYSKAIRSEERKLAAEMARLFKVHLDAQRRGAEAYARTWLRRVGGAKETATEKAVAATDLQAGLGGAAGTDMGGATTAVAKAEEPSLKAIKKAIERALSKDILASMRKGINVGAKPVAAAFGIGFKESDPKVVEFLADHRTRLEDVMDDYSAEVTKKAISEAYEEGLGEQGIVKAIRDAAGWSEARAQRVGRTESHVATQFGAQEAAEQAGVETKTWITSGDDRVRESHREANGQKRDIDEPFDVGDAELMYPGDPEGGADEPGEVISCRCVTGFGFKKSLSSASASLTKSLSPSGDAGAVELVKGGIAALPDRIVIDAPDDASPIKAVSGEGSEATYDADTATLRIGPTAKAEDVADAIVEHLAAGLLTDEEADELEDELDDAGFPTEAEPGRASAAKRVADLALGRSLSKGMGEDQSIRFALIVQQYGTWPAELGAIRKAFDPSQQRDEAGRWISTGAGIAVATRHAFFREYSRRLAAEKKKREGIGAALKRLFSRSAESERKMSDRLWKEAEEATMKMHDFASRLAGALGASAEKLAKVQGEQRAKLAGRIAEQTEIVEARVADLLKIDVVRSDEGLRGEIEDWLEEVKALGEMAREARKERGK